MPLSAIIGDQTIIGPDLSPDEWNDLKWEHKKGLPVIMRCCGAKGHLRTSKNGLQHFYHAPGSEPCSWGPESLAHLKLKNEIYQICKAAGWKSSIEYTSIVGDWRADVYAENYDKKIVFEVQLTKIPLTELKERDLKYKRYGIESYWILKNKSKYPLNDYQGFEELSHTHYIDGYYSSGTKYASLEESLNKSKYFIPKDVISICINPDTHILVTEDDEEILLSEWINSILDGSYQLYLLKIREEYQYYYNLRQIARPILNEVHDLHCRIFPLIDDLNKQYAIFKNNSIENSHYIKENFRDCYNYKKEMTKFFFGKVLSEKLGWKWLRDDYDSWKILHLKTSEQLYEIQKLSKDALKIIDKFEMLIKGLSYEIQSNSKTTIKTPVTPLSRKTVRFEANSNLTDNWLIASNGMKHQVIPGLSVDMDQQIALEFEKKGFGRIVSNKREDD